MGQELRVDGTQYTVIGVSEKQGSTFGAEPGQLGGDSADGVPEELRHGKDADHLCEGGQRRGEQLERGADEVRVLMRSQRHDAPGAPQSFELDTNNTLVGFFSDRDELVWRGGRGHRADLAGRRRHRDYEHHAGERDRADARDRHPQGAGRAGKDILLQFLVESATMALVGGAIGVLGGVVVAQVVTLVLGFPSTVAFWSVLVGLIMATGYGNLLRSVSGAEGRAAGSDCGAESGLRTVVSCWLLVVGREQKQ